MTHYFVDIDPIAFSVPEFTLRWYWAALAVLVLCGFAWRTSRQPVDGSPELAGERRSTVIFLLAFAAVFAGAAGFMLIKGMAYPIGPIGVHWYGIMYLLGFGAAWWLGQRRRAAGRLAVTRDEFSDLCFYLMLGVILGGRIGYMLFYNTAELAAHPLSLLRVWEGGMSFHGGLLGVLVAGLIWTRRRKIGFFDTIDFIAPLVPIGLGLGRFGNFVGGELWGRHTDVAWGMIFPRALDSLEKTREQLQQMYVAGQLNNEARHPSQLYEFALEGLVLFAVLWIYSRKPRPRYAVSGLFALLYGLFRFSVEFVREPDIQLGFLAFDWVTMGQILSLPLIAVGLFLLWLSRSAPTLPVLAPAVASDEPSSHSPTPKSSA